MVSHTISQMKKLNDNLEETNDSSGGKNLKKVGKYGMFSWDNIGL